MKTSKPTPKKINTEEDNNQCERQDFKLRTAIQTWVSYNKGRGRTLKEIESAVMKMLRFAFKHGE